VRDAKVDAENAIAASDVEISRAKGTHASFSVTAENKGVEPLVIKVVRFSREGIKIAEGIPSTANGSEWTIGPGAKKEIFWNTKESPVVKLGNMTREFAKQYQAVLEVYLQYEILGKIVSRDRQKILVNVDPQNSTIDQL
jgi:hypothetical protein